jgi:hypothetical protein
MRTPAKVMIEQVASGKPIKRLLEFVTKTDNCGTTRLTPDSYAKFREIAEKHFANMAAELEAAGLTAFSANIDDAYASISLR